MRFPTPLVPGRLIRRYKRFLADVVLADGREVIAHCPNPGAMLGLDTPDLKVWLEPNKDPKKKLKFGWRLVELPNGHMVGIDTGVPNRVVKEALLWKAVSSLADYTSFRSEVPYGERSRVDFLATGLGLPDAYVEVKNVHLRREDDWAEFPDCVTERGAKHLNELAQVADTGHRAVMLYLVQRTDCHRVKLAGDLDPRYVEAAAAASERGVEMIAYGTTISTEGVQIGRALPVTL